MFDGAHVHRLEAKHEPTHVNRGGGSAAMFYPSLRWRLYASPIHGRK